MPDLSGNSAASSLPPKLNARKIVGMPSQGLPAGAPAKGSAVQSALKPGPPTAQAPVPASATSESVRPPPAAVAWSTAAQSAAAQAPASKPVSGPPAAVAESVHAAPPKSSGPAEGKPVPTLPKAPEIVTAAKPESQEKSSTQAAAKRPDTICLKKPSEILKPPDKEGEPALTPAPMPAPTATPKGASSPTPTAGPTTIRVKRPAGIVAAAMPRKTGDTKEISLEGPGPAGEVAAVLKPAEETPSPAPTTIRVKKPAGITIDGGSGATATTKISLGDTKEIGEDATAETQITRTVQIKKPGELKSTNLPPKILKIQRSGQENAEQPLTERKTISIQRPTRPAVSELSARLAKEEKELMGEIRTREQPGHVGSVCAFAAAAIVVICVVIWIFLTQLLPKEKSFNWPGRILPHNDPYFTDETNWL